MIAIGLDNHYENRVW